MIKHVVLLSFAANVSEEKINNALEKLGSLRQKEIPQIKSFSFGKNISPEDQSNGFNYVFIMDFARAVPESPSPRGRNPRTNVSRVRAVSLNSTP